MSNKKKLVRVDFKSPEHLLKEFDEVVFALNYPSRTYVFLSFMRNMVKVHSVDKAAKEAGL